MTSRSSGSSGPELSRRTAPKPAPDGVLYLLDKYGLDREDTLMTGDRELDVMAGKNAGTYGCLFTKEKNIETNADFVISDISEILDIQGGHK